MSHEKTVDASKPLRHSIASRGAAAEARLRCGWHGQGATGVLSCDIPTHTPPPKSLQTSYCIHLLVKHVIQTGLGMGMGMGMNGTAQVRPSRSGGKRPTTSDGPCDLAPALTCSARLEILPAAMRCDMVLHQALRAGHVRKSGSGGEVRHGVTSGASCETYLNKLLIPHLNRE